MLSPELASLRGRMGAHRLHALYDSTELTRNAREASGAALDERLLDEIDPDGKLSQTERQRRLHHARKSHFAGLAFKSAQARRRKAGRDA